MYGSGLPILEFAFPTHFDHESPAVVKPHPLQTTVDERVIDRDEPALKSSLTIRQQVHVLRAMIVDQEISEIGAHVLQRRAENLEAKRIMWWRKTAGFESFQHVVTERNMQSALVDLQMETTDRSPRATYHPDGNDLPSRSDSTQELKVQTRERTTGRNAVGSAVSDQSTKLFHLQQRVEFIQPTI